MAIYQRAVERMRNRPLVIEDIQGTNRKHDANHELEIQVQTNISNENVPHPPASDIYIHNNGRVSLKRQSFSRPRIPSSDEYVQKKEKQE